MIKQQKRNSESFGRPLRFSHIFGYNLGKAMEVLMVTTIANIAIPFYSMSLKINPAWIGAAMALPRVLDAITDIAMGWLSDNTKTRWGRRRPWMFVGGILSGLFFWFIWTPPVNWGEVGIFIYFLVLSSVFYVAMTLYLVPYYALGNELTPDPDVRVRIMGVRSLVWGLATIVTPWAYKLFYCPWFGNNEVEGARVVGLIIGVICAVFAVISVISSRENPAVMKQAYIPIGRALFDTLHCKPFWIMITVATMSIFGFGLVSGFNMFVGTYHVFDGDRAAMANLWGYVGMTWGISAVVFSCFVEKIIKRIGEKTTLYLSLMLIIAGASSSWWAYNPRFPMLAVITTLLSAPGVIGILTVAYVWLSDICDYDELASGKRREGVFSSIMSFVTKSTLALAGGVAGLLAVVAGVDTDLAQQSAQTIFNLRILFALVPVVFAVCSIYFVCIYPLTKEKMVDIRRQLNSLNNRTDCVETS